MGLDTYLDITIRPKTSPDSSERTIPLCYFRKCYSIANDIAEQMGQYFDVPDGDFVTIKPLNSESDYDNDDLVAILFKVRDILTHHSRGL